MSKLPAKHFYMIRHGETVSNAAKILAGHLDTPLTKTGRTQAFDAQKTVESLKIKPTAIFHSHLTRARDTAQIINKNLRLPIFEDKDLAEINAGILEGQPIEKCGDIFNTWPDIEGGEAANDFFNRVKHGKTKALNAFDEPVLIVCHGGVMRAFGQIHNIETAGRFTNAHLYEFIPCPNNPSFPWTVHDYKLCEKNGDLIKNISNVYKT